MSRTAEQVRWSIEDPLLAAVPLLLAWLMRSGWLPGAGGAALAAAVITIAALVIGIEEHLEYRREETSPVGRRQLPRVALVAAVAVLQPTVSESIGGPASALGTSLAMLIIIAGLILEPAVARGAASRRVFVHGLPGITPLPLPNHRLPAAVLWSSLAATALGAGFAWLDRADLISAGPWFWAALSLVPAGVLLAFLAQTGRRIRQHQAIERDLPGAIAAYGPRFVIYTARPDDASYQVLMWLPYLKRAGLPFMIVTRDVLPARVLAELTDVPIVVRRTIAGLDDVIAPSLQAAFYVNASSGNGAFIRYGHLDHVYLGHGDSDKPPSYNPTHAMYDLIFAAGPAATRRYAEHGVQIPADRFRVVGRPQVEDVEVITGRGAESMAEAPVLYAPTWRGHVTETQLSSLPVGLRIVEALLARGRTVIFRPHPFSYHYPEDTALVERIQRLLAEDAARTGRRHVWGAPAESERTVLECTNESSAMIADVSAIVSDYLYSRKPFAMVAVPAGDFVTQYPIARGAYVLDGDLANLEPVLDDLLGADPHAEVRAEIRADYLGDFPADGYADAFVDAVRDVSTTESTSHAGRGLSEPDEPSKPSRRANLRRQVSALAGGAVAGGLAALALAADLLDAPALVSVLPALAALVLIAWLRRTMLPTPSRWDSLLTFAGPARLLLAVGLAVVVGPGPTTVLTMIMVALCIAAESAIRRGWGRQGVEVANLPALGVEVGRPLVWQLTWIGSLIVITIGWLTWWTPVGGWLTLAAAVTAAGDHRRRPGPDRDPGAPGGLGRGAPAAGGGRSRAPVRGLLRVADRRALPVGHVAAVLRPDRPAVRDRHPGSEDAAGDLGDRHGAGDLPAVAGQPGGGDRPVADHLLLRQQRGEEHPLRRAPGADPRLAQPRRLGEAGLLQPGARDLRSDLRRRAGRHRPLRPARGRDPGREVPHRRPAAGRVDHPGRNDDQRGRAADRAVRPDLAGVLRRHPGLFAAGGGADRRGAAAARRPGGLPGPSVQLPVSGRRRI